MSDDFAAARDGGAARVLRLASYNIHRAVGADRRKDLARIREVIAEIDADIVALQEVDWHHDEARAASQFEYLSEIGGYRTLSGPNIQDHRGHYGNVVLTRFPVGEVRRVDLSEPGREPRGAIDADIETAGGMVRLVATHLGLNWRERWRQARRLRELLQERMDRPVLLVGDFNDWLPGSPTLRPLLALCDTAPHPPSYPSRRPLFALDRVFAFGLPGGLHVRRHVSPLARVASDHLPVVAEVELRAASAAGVSAKKAGTVDAH